MSLRRTSTRPGRRRAAYGAVGLLVLVAFGAIFVAMRSSSAEAGPLPGITVPAEYRPAFLEAAKSCPALTPAKLAGHVMEESRFSPTATDGRGGRGLAGLTDAEWKIWQPWSDASRTDGRANILALAHLSCDLVGQIRVAALSGDAWQLAVGAFYSGMAAVKAAKAVPAAAQAYVDRVVGYAAWYDLQPDLAGPTTVSVSASASTSAPVLATPTDPLSGSVSAPSRTATPVATPATTTVPATTPPPPTVAPPLTSGALWNEEFHGCLSADKALDGTHLIITGCDGSMVQHWQPMADGTIRSVGLCMDAANAGTADFTPVQVAYCSGNPAQLFTLDQQQHLYSAYANKCVNIHYVAGVGTSIVLYSCLNQTNQFWVWRQQ